MPEVGGHAGSELGLIDRAPGAISAGATQRPGSAAGKTATGFLLARLLADRLMPR